MAGDAASQTQRQDRQFTMKLTRLNDEQHHILKLVVEEYFVVLPPALKVHSLFATHILSQTLQHYGIRTRVIPCRLWSSLNPKFEFAGGFVNFTNVEKWNGHVVCLAGEWLIDAALYHLNPTYNYEVPKIIARRIVMPERGTYARYRMNKNVEFVWYRLPPEVPLVPLTGYEDYIDRFVTKLVAHINKLLGIVEEPVEELTTNAGLVCTEGTEELTEDTTEGAVDDETLSELEDALLEAPSEGDEQTTSVESLLGAEASSEVSEEATETAEAEGQTIGAEELAESVLPTESDAGEAAILSEDIEVSAEASPAGETPASESAREENAQPA